MKTITIYPGQSARLTMRSYVAFSNMTREQKIEGYTKYISNQRQCPKHSLGYMIGMVLGRSSCWSLWPESYKRAELLDVLTTLAKEENNIDKLIASDYTKNKVETLYNKNRNTAEIIK